MPTNPIDLSDRDRESLAAFLVDPPAPEPAAGGWPAAVWWTLAALCGTALAAMGIVHYVIVYL